MAMAKKTAEALKKMACLKGQILTPREWSKWANHAGITYQTFRNWTNLERTDELREVTLEFLVNELNACAGADCYGGNWFYKVVDGKPYEVIEKYKWVE